MKREEFEAAREAKTVANKAARATQEEIDFDAITKLQDSLGLELHTEDVTVFVDGSCAVVAYKAPGAEYKRYVAKVRTAGQNMKARAEAHDELGESCWIYPPKDSPLRMAVLDANRGIVTSLAVRVAALAELKKEEEGKS